MTDAVTPAPYVAHPEEAGFRQLRPGLTILVPAYNEAGSLVATIASLQAQTRPATRVVVIDDGSTDGTGAIAAAMGVEVVRPPHNTGSKAGAQSFALPRVDTEFCMAIDADTVLAPDAVALILPALEADPGVAAACGFVLPRHVRSVWERGRYIEYLFAFSFFKQVQDYYERPLIASGCFSAYRTATLCALGGWSNRTLAEDMDLTWTLYRHGWRVRFVPEAVCYPIEPHDWRFLSAQLRRWSHGFVQNLRLHWRHLLDQPHLRMFVGVALWDATVASVLYLVLLPVLAVLVTPLALLVYVIDAPVVAVPALAKGAERGEVRRALASLPSFFVLRLVNSLFFLRALWVELVLGRRLAIYQKGH